MTVDIDFMIEQPSPSNSPKMGTFWLYQKLDFSKTPILDDGSAKIMRVKDLWVIRDSYWRCTVASSAASTFDIGIDSIAGGYAHTDHSILADGASSAGNWAQGSIEPATPTILTVDSIVFVEIEVAAITDGILEVMLEIVAGPEDNEPADMQFDNV
jgi:hypothetical protein